MDVWVEEMGATYRQREAFCGDAIGMTEGVQGRGGVKI
jgi:hypothetical protein